MEKEVERIHVVVGGLLEMHAVGAHLTAGLLQGEVPPDRPPAPRGRQFGTQRADEEERDGLTEQVRIGGEIGRQYRSM